MKKLFDGKLTKVLALLLSFVLVLSLAACSSSSSDTEDEEDTEETEADTADEEEEEEEDEEESEVTEITIGLTATSSNNHYFLDDGTETGYEYEFILALDEVLEDYSITIITEEFSSLFVSLDSGTVDAVVGNLRRNDEREASYIHTYRAYNYSPYRIIVEEDNTDINSIDDLDGKRLGISQGSLQAYILEEYQETHDISIEFVYTSDYTNELVSGNIDAFIAPEYTLDQYNTSFEDVQFKIVGEEVAGEEGLTADSNTYIYLAQGSEELRNVLSEAIYELRENGTLSELSLEFNSEDYTARINTDFEEELIESLGLE